MNIEQIDKDIEKLDIEDLFEIITQEPLLSGEISIKSYSNEQRKILKNKVLEIAKLSLDLAKLECKFIKEKVKNIKSKDKKFLKYY